MYIFVSIWKWVDSNQWFIILYLILGFGKTECNYLLKSQIKNKHKRINSSWRHVLGTTLELILKTNIGSFVKAIT